MKINFRLPNTRLCLVLWYRNNKPQEKVLMDTPPNNEDLRHKMLQQGIGYGEIRAVEPVSEETLTESIQHNFGSNFRRTA